MRQENSRTIKLEQIADQLCTELQADIIIKTDHIVTVTHRRATLYIEAATGPAMDVVIAHVTGVMPTLILATKAYLDRAWIAAFKIHAIDDWEDRELFEADQAIHFPPEGRL